MRTTRKSPRPHDDRPRRPARALAHVARITAALTVVGLLGACSVRLETPPPAEPSPGPVEQVRARTLDDATELASAARAALATTPSKAVAAVLADVADFSAQHATQLGPEYDSGLTPPPTGTPAPVTAAPDEVLADLADATRTALTDSDAVEDGDLARLVASIATARDQLARRLARATGVKAPDLAMDAPSAEPSPSVSAAPATQGTESDLETLVLAHDQAGYAYEVIAAQQAGDVRDQAVTAADAHRAAAQRWADAAGIAETDRDPRRAAYTLPDGLTKTTTARKLAVSLESAITEADATLVGRTPAGDRRPFIAGMRTATAAARSWGGAPLAFPCPPERAQS
jgi:hypothetical protein